MRHRNKRYIIETTSIGPLRSFGWLSRDGGWTLSREDAIQFSRQDAETALKKLNEHEHGKARIVEASL